MRARVVIATVAESREPFLTEAYWLFHSIRRFGGVLADSKCVVYFVDQAPLKDPGLNQQDVEIRVVNTLEPRYPHSNKIHMLLDEHRDYDWLVALDTDVIITGDFSPYLTGSAVAAKQVDQNPLTEDNWRTIFNYFGLTYPSDRYLTHFHAEESIPYFNSGVLFIPAEYVTELGKMWHGLIAEVIKLYDREPEIAKHSFFTDQIAFALAVAKSGFPYRALPLELNFPTHSPVHPMFSPDKIAPLILHHHHKKDANQLIGHCDYPNVNSLIDRFNKSLD